MLRRHVVYFVDGNVARIHRDERANINIQQPVCIQVSDVIRLFTVRCNVSTCVRQTVFIGLCVILLDSLLKISEFPFGILI